MTTTKFVSWNVNGIRASVKKGFGEIVEDFSADFFCVQETKAQVDEVEKALEPLEELKGYSLYANSAVKKGYSGVAILAKHPAKSVIQGIGEEEHDTEGRVITLEYPKFYLVNVYVPNSGAGLKRLEYRSDWDRSFALFLHGLNQKKQVVVCGDFNVAHHDIDLARPKQNYNKTSGYTQTEIDGFDGILSGDLLDSFRYLHPDEVKYTFWSMRFGARAKNVGWRIDYFLVSDKMRSMIEEAEIHNDVMGSDHCPISLNLSL
jgi:exodeoxyribonuclease-3